MNASEPFPLWKRRGVFLIVGLLIATGITARFCNLGRMVYWYDEAYTSLWISGSRWSDAKSDLADREVTPRDILRYQRIHPDRSVVDTVRALADYDPHHPPLYYALVRIWAGLAGDSVGSVRSFLRPGKCCCAASHLLALPVAFRETVGCLGGRGTRRCVALPHSLCARSQTIYPVDGPDAPINCCASARHGFPFRTSLVRLLTHSGGWALCTPAVLYGAGSSWNVHRLGRFAAVAPQGREASPRVRGFSSSPPSSGCCSLCLGSSCSSLTSQNPPAALMGQQAGQPPSCCLPDGGSTTAFFFWIRTAVASLPSL